MIIKNDETIRRHELEIQRLTDAVESMKKDLAQMFFKMHEQHLMESKIQRMQTEMLTQNAAQLIELNSMIARELIEQAPFGLDITRLKSISELMEKQAITNREMGAKASFGIAHEDRMEALLESFAAAYGLPAPSFTDEPEADSSDS